MNVLVVDDDVELCRLLSRFLEKHGHTVYSAGDALQAMDVLDRNPVGLVITDYRMPHVDGIHFTEMLKSDPRTRNVPVILMTANVDESVTDKGMRKGVALTLHKPIDFNQLLTLVRFAET